MKASNSNIHEQDVYRENATTKNIKQVFRNSSCNNLI